MQYILEGKTFVETHVHTIFLNFYAAGNIFNKKCHVFTYKKNEYENFFLCRGKKAPLMSKYEVLHSLFQNERHVNNKKSKSSNQ